MKRLLLCIVFLVAGVLLARAFPPQMGRLVSAGKVGAVSKVAVEQLSDREVPLVECGISGVSIALWLILSALGWWYGWN